MGKRTRTRAATDRGLYSVDAEWSEADLALLRQLKKTEALLPDDAPRALLSVRLSVLTDDTTSPVRQELDLRLLARERGCRVVGVASDLNVSATKVPPWKRKELVLQPHLLWLAVRLVVELITGGAARWALPGLLTAPAGIGF